MHPLFILLIIQRKFPALVASFLHCNTYNPPEHNPNYFRETIYTELLPQLFIPVSCLMKRPWLYYAYSLLFKSQTIFYSAGD